MTFVEKISKLRSDIEMHEQWISNNSYDADGVKDRQEWIAECEAEIETLESE